LAIISPFQHPIISPQPLDHGLYAITYMVELGIHRMRCFLVIFVAASIAFNAVPGVAQLPKQPERLLTDEELMTEADPSAGTVDATTAAWVRQNSYPLRSLTADDYQDLQFLKPLLKGKRVVQLGESGHGVAEFNLAKVRLTKFLHQEMGFDVIAFESPLYECYFAEQQVEAQPPSGVLRNCLIAVWHTREVLPLFDYIRDAKRGPRPLTLAGFDIQQRGWGEQGRAEFLREALVKIDPTYAEEVYQLDKEFQKKTIEGAANFAAYLKVEATRLIAAYDKLARFLAQTRAKSKDKLTNDFKKLAVAHQTARSLSQLIRHQTAADRMTSEIRDKGMAENLDFLLDELYPGKKVIVWAHNQHVRHKNEAIAAKPMRMMGSWLVGRHRKELYTIGFYVYRGRMANNSRTVYDVERAKAGSLESILYQARKKFIFLDLAKQKRRSGNEWVFTAIPTFNLGKDEEVMIPKDQYDGIVFIDTVNPPRYGVR
jgi:erythromycin esterase